jgi:hypothetical protein
LPRLSITVTIISSPIIMLSPASLLKINISNSFQKLTITKNFV